MAPETAFILIKLQCFTYCKHAQLSWCPICFKTTFIPTKVREVNMISGINAISTKHLGPN